MWISNVQIKHHLIHLLLNKVNRTVNEDLLASILIYRRKYRYIGSANMTINNTINFHTPQHNYQKVTL